MSGDQFKYTHDQYISDGIEPFLDQVRAYLGEEALAPVSQTVIRDHRGEPTVKGGHSSVEFTFVDELYGQLVAEKLNKPYDAAMRFGYAGGYSKGERNGILLQRTGNHDRRMRSATDRLIGSNLDTILERLDVDEDGLDDLRKVKIVWHNPGKGRVVGVYNTKNSKMLFLGHANY